MKKLNIIFALLLITACAESQETGNQEMESEGAMNQETEAQTDTQTETDFPEFGDLVVVLHPTEGNEVSGTVRFTEENEGVRVNAEIEGLEPNSTHGFHIHQFGDCTASDGSSAGGHYNPHDMPHGGPDDDQRHVGDLGNLDAGEDGTASAEYVDSVISFTGSDSILGRGFIVHAGEDDLESQPSGDAGNRLACGVIGVAQE